MTDADTAVQKICATYTSAVRAKNVETFMHLYDPDVRVFDTWGVWCYEGAAAWQRAIEGWFSSLGTETVQVSFDEVRTHADGRLSTVSAIVGYDSFSAQGERQRGMQNRISWVLKTSGHVLRIVHEHTSVPMGFADQKGMLQRNASG